MAILSKWARQTGEAYQKKNYKGIDNSKGILWWMRMMEGIKKQTTYFIKKDKANGKKIKQVVWKGKILLSE